MVRDENDNAPEFEQEHYTFEIEENNEPNAVVAKVTARDADSGINGMIR